MNHYPTAFHRKAALFFLSLIFSAILLLHTALAHATPITHNSAPLPTTTSLSGMMFIENVGQFDEAVRFQANGPAGKLWLTQDGIWLSVLEPEPAIEPGLPAPPASTKRRGVVLKLSFPGANPQPRLEPINPLPPTINYFKGNNPANWRTNVPVWGGVRYVDLYPGLDLELSDGQPRLVVRNRAAAFQQLGRVQLRVEGATQTTLVGNSLRVTTAVGQLDLPLLAVVTADGSPLQLPLAAPAQRGAEIATPFAAAVSSPQLIQTAAAADQLIYSALLGGSSYEAGNDIAVDPDGRVYVTGDTNSADLPVTPGAYDDTLNNGDLFVARLNPTGTQWDIVTFLGGSSTESGHGLALDSNRNVYLTGLVHLLHRFPHPKSTGRQLER